MDSITTLKVENLNYWFSSSHKLVYDLEQLVVLYSCSSFICKMHLVGCKRCHYLKLPFDFFKKMLRLKRRLTVILSSSIQISLDDDFLRGTEQWMFSFYWLRRVTVSLFSSSAVQRYQMHIMGIFTTGNSANTINLSFSISESSLITTTLVTRQV